MRMKDADKKKLRRRPVNMSIREDIIAESKAYGLNASEISEAALAAAVKKAKEEEWLKNAMPAIEAHNERVRTHGLYLKPYWMKDKQ